MLTTNFKPYYDHEAIKDDDKNASLLAERIAKYDKKEGPRVGDYLLLPNNKFTRFTYDWNDHIQTGGGNASFHLGDGYISYSGGMNPGIKKIYLQPTRQTMEGSIWFFSRGWMQAHNGVYYSIPFRVFIIKSDTPKEALRGLWLDNDSPYSGNYEIK